MSVYMKSVNMLPNKNVEVSHGQILACIADQLDLTAHQDMKRLEARLKQLRSKAHIPPPSRQNLGPNARYAFSELWKLAVVFAAVDTSVDTLRAAMIVKLYWPDIGLGLANAWTSRESHAGDPILLQIFSGVIDGFTKHDNEADWIEIEAKKQLTEGPLPLVWVDRMGNFFAPGSGGRFPPDTHYRPMVGCVLINLSALIEKTTSTLIGSGHFKGADLDDYFRSVIAEASPAHS